MLEMARIAAVLRVFRAVIAATMEISSLLALTAVGGVRRSSGYRLLGIGDWPTTIPISSVTAASSRFTVFLFVASGIKNGTIWLLFGKRRGAGLSALANFFFNL